MTTERKKELLELKKAKRRKDSQKCYNKKKAMQATKHKMLSLSDEAARKRKYRANIKVQGKFDQKKKKDEKGTEKGKGNIGKERKML